MPLRVSIGALLLWVCAGGPAPADAAKITGGVEPAYAACLSAKSSCSNVARTQFRVQYTPVAVRGFSVRIRLSRAYQMTVEDDKDEGSSEEQQTGKFDPPYDVVDVKLRFTEPDGRDRFELRSGYAFQHSAANAAGGYHTAYVSWDYYFGGAIPSSFGGRSRRIDVVVKASENRYLTSMRLPEQLAQLVTTYTVPLDSDAGTRIYASYARELRFGGGDTVRTPSNRFEFGAYRNAMRWLEFYGRISAFATRGVAGTAKVAVGADISLY